MLTMTATEVARNFSRVLDTLEHKEKEIAITRNSRTVARLVPETQATSGLETLKKVWELISEEEGAAWMADIEKGNPGWLSDEMRDPWEE